MAVLGLLVVGAVAWKMRGPAGPASPRAALVAQAQVPVQVRLGGLGELRIKHRVLSPSEILQSLRYLPDRQHVPFADNGCGDLYCWPLARAAEPAVLFADHETGYTYSEAAASFTDWLEAERF